MTRKRKRDTPVQRILPESRERVIRAVKAGRTIREAAQFASLSEQTTRAICRAEGLVWASSGFGPKQKQPAQEPLHVAPRLTGEVAKWTGLKAAMRW